MKNVAGYDVSRLMVGAMGCLGIITDVAIKVLPEPEREDYYRLDIGPAGLQDKAQQWARYMTPVSGICHDGESALIRLEGLSDLLDHFAKQEGLVHAPDSVEFWAGLRRLTLPFFQTDLPLWRVSLPKGSRFQGFPSGRFIMDWAGNQCWLLSDDSEEVQALATRQSGEAYAFHSGATAAFPELPQGQMRLHMALKRAYDPAGIINPGRMYATL